MKRDHATRVLLVAWLAASAACEADVVDGTTSSSSSSSSSSGAGAGGGSSTSCVLDQSKLDECVLK